MKKYVTEKSELKALSDYPWLYIISSNLGLEASIQFLFHSPNLLFWNFPTL